MAARRCSLCGINYPTIVQFVTCPIHDEPTQVISNLEPDDNWSERFDRLRAEAAADAALRETIPLAAGVSVIKEAGLLFVDQTELQRAGVRLSRRVPDQWHLFSLDDGWVYEAQGWDEPRRRWWVERVIPTEEEASQRTTSAGVHSSTESATS